MNGKDRNLSRAQLLELVAALRARIRTLETAAELDVEVAKCPHRASLS